MNKKFIFMVLTIALSLALAVLAIDSRLKTVCYTVENGYSDSPFRVVLITDLHSCTYGGEEQTDFMEAVRAQNPDVVLLGGDIFDDKMPEDDAYTALEMLGKEFSCFYVTGNHEVRRKNLEERKEKLRVFGITVLDKENPAEINIGGAHNIEILGFDDTTAYENLEAQLADIKSAAENSGEESFKILLIHRPEHIEHYKALGFDLVLCGHAHGGQWRIPGILNGLYAPGQGFFPKYAGGKFILGETTLIVSRGLAKESTPLPRIFNRPELVVIDIE